MIIAIVDDKWLFVHVLHILHPVASNPYGVIQHDTFGPLCLGHFRHWFGEKRGINQLHIAC